MWRVACVRIPRFPIGAVWRRAIAEGNGQLLMPPGSDVQLALPMLLEPGARGTREAVGAPGAEAPPSPPNDGVPNRPSGATSSSSALGTTPAMPRGVDRAGGGDGHWDTLPIALLDGQRVRAATAGAGRARVGVGMTIAEARSRCAGLRVTAWDDETIAHEVVRTTAAFVMASPQVTPVAGAPGMWWVGASGFETSGGGGELALARRLLAIARRWHPGARVGIADSCVAARAATWAAERPARPPRPTRPPSSPSPTRPTGPVGPVGPTGPTGPHVAGGAMREGGEQKGEPGIVIVPCGGCAAYLASAPLGIIPMEEEMRETLQALGLRAAGGLATLEVEDVERRWGAAGVAAWRLARGEDRRRPVLARLDAARAVSADLVPSAPTVEPVLFLVRAALDRLVQTLVADGRAAVVVALTLALDDRRGPLPHPTRAHTMTREVRLSRPLGRVVPLFERCRALLDEWKLPAPVCGVTVAITATAPLTGEQGELLDPAWRDPAAADAAFARLRATLGTSAIVRPVLRDTHRPERAGEWERVDDPGHHHAGRPHDTPHRSPASSAIPSPALPSSFPQPGASRQVSPAPAPSPPSPRTPTPPLPNRPLALVREGACPSTVAPAPRAAVSASEGRASEGLPRTPSSSHTPAPAFTVPAFAPSPVAVTPHSPALRQLDPPERIEVQCDAGAPRLVRWGERGVRIARAIGPERLTGDWWEDRYARDYWRCEDAAGATDLLIYREREGEGPSRWFVHGWYD